MKHVEKELMEMHDLIPSWRTLAAMPAFQDEQTGKRIHYATLNAYAAGRPIVNNIHRRILGLSIPETSAIDLCPVCLKVHLKACPVSTHSQVRTRRPMWNDLWAWYPGSYVSE